MIVSAGVGNHGVERFVGQEKWNCLYKQSGIGCKCKERLENHCDKMKI